MSIVLVGKPNVGKSRLFNKLVGRRKALVSPIPGTTRDWKSGQVNWRGQTITMIDTGGLVLKPETDVVKSITKQTNQALKKAKLAVLVIDGTAPVTVEDKAILKILRTKKKSFLIAINKIDGPKKKAEASEHYRLGSDLFFVSAANGTGTGDLLDAILEQVTGQDAKDDIKRKRIILIGRPNVGKSTLINSLINEDRLITSPTPHTTREPQEIVFNWQDKPWLLIDTAGRRKRGKQKDLEKIGADIANKELDRANLALLMIDLAEPATRQDKFLAGLIKKARRPFIVVANKWDLVEDKTAEREQELIRVIRQDFPFIKKEPIVIISALGKKGFKKLLRTIDDNLLSPTQWVTRTH